MTKAMGYTRISGRGQEDGDGPERQRLAIQRYADSHGIVIEQWFHDTQTGKDRWEDRDGWSSMIAALNGTRTIIVERMDRVARELLVSELIMADLKKRGITLLTSSGEDSSDESPERVMFRQLLSLFASYERSSIVHKLRGARQRKKSATGKCEGRKLYGDKPGEAEILEDIIRRRRCGRTLQVIVDGLNSEGIASRTGGRWSVGTVGKILAREQNAARDN